MVKLNMLLLKIITLVLTIPLASYFLSTILTTDLLFFLSLFSCFTPEIYGGLFQPTILYQDLDLILSTFIPITIYSNADTDKLKVLKDNKGKSGIYQWSHLESGKIYIGSAVDLSKRLMYYYSKSFLNRDKNMYICNALISHTHSAFSISILEYIDTSNLSKEQSRKLILEREQHYLDTLQPEYNILKVAGNSLGYKHSKESLTKISEALKGENNPMYGKIGKENPMFGQTLSPDTLVKMSKAKKGISRSAETKAKISEALLGRIHLPESLAKMSEAKTGQNNPNFGKSLSKETKAKISEALSKKVFIYFFDPISNKIILHKCFDNYLDTSKYFNCTKRTLFNYIDKNKLFKEQWVLSTIELPSQGFFKG
jgi:group I intron endonuclease